MTPQSNIEKFLTEAEGRLKAATPGSDYYGTSNADLAKLLEIVRVYKSSLEDALFVLEGSIAIEGQSDELLERRDGALMRVFEADTKANAIAGGEIE